MMLTADGAYLLQDPTEYEAQLEYRREREPRAIVAERERARSAFVQSAERHGAPASAEPATPAARTSRIDVAATFAKLFDAHYCDGDATYPWGMRGAL
ncbi:MAG: hypothetical protein JWM41_2180 [Gemmatimonadetes bacterium]|nr:hypothetical protein [Gemmatimonadota bacterium]